MFSHFSLQIDPQNSDDALDVDEDSLLSEYQAFYNDVYSELTSRWGRIVGLRTCRNHSEHLRGNVYVEFKGGTAAADALQGCQGRWYAGRQLNCRLAYLGCGWKGAICGLFHRGDRCHKGDSGCNFLHVFLNPGEDERDVYLALNQNLPELPRSRRNSSSESRYGKFSERMRHGNDRFTKDYTDFEDHRHSRSHRRRRYSRSPQSPVDQERRYCRSPRRKRTDSENREHQDAGKSVKRRNDYS